MKNDNLPSDIDAKILLVGDISKAFSNPRQVRQMRCRIYSSILDAIEAAGKNSFAVIAVVMSGMQGKLNSSLRALRSCCGEAKIILLAQMHQEPTAIQLVNFSSNGSKAADDYLICPIDFSYLVSHLPLPPQFLAKQERGQDEATGISNVEQDRLRASAVSSQAEPARSATIDATTEAKIKQLERLATEDEMTGLKNRRYIWEFSRQIIEKARSENGHVTLLVFDIDNFKHYNDVYGHSAGDEILRQAAVLMKRCCRTHDVVGRIGGDEFAVIFWDDPQRKRTNGEAERRSASGESRGHPTEAIFIAKRFRRALEKAKFGLLGPEGRGELTISGGLASSPGDGETVQELFEQADEALLEAKRSGKNRIYLVGRPKDDIADIQ